MVNIGDCSPVHASVPAHPDPSSISPDTWRRFESVTRRVMHKIQPTVSSDQLRAAVIDYVQRLFRSHAGYQVLRLHSLQQIILVVVYSILRNKASGFIHQ